MNRGIVLLLALGGGALAGFAAAAALAVLGTGVLWLFVFGDDPWPEWVDPVFNGLVVAVGFGTMATITWLLFARMGRSR